MRLQKSWIASAVCGGWVGLFAGFCSLYLVILPKTRRLGYYDVTDWPEWSVIGVYYFVIPLVMGFAAGVQPKLVARDKLTDHCYLSIVLFLFGPFLLLYFSDSSSIHINLRIHLGAIFLITLLSIFGSIALLPWIWIMDMGHKWGQHFRGKWVQGTLRDESFGRWSRGEIER